MIRTPPKRSYVPSKRFKTTRKTTSRRRAIVNTMVTIPRQLGSFPPMYKCTLKYADSVFVSVALGGAGAYFFSCNGLFDPDITSTGHQPLYFDQLALIYNHYHVVSSRITWQPCPVVNIPFQYTTVIEDDTTLSAGTAIYPVSERPGASTIVVNTSVSGIPKIKQSWSYAKNFGGSIMSNDNAKGTSGANPSEQQYYVLFVCDQAGGASSVYCTVTVEYDVIWNEYKSIAAS